MANKTTKTQLRNFDKNFIEAGRDITNGVVDSVKKDLLQQGVNTAWKRFLGDFSDMNSKDTQNGVKEGPVASGDLREGEELDLVIKTEWAKVEPALNYMDSYRNDVLHFEERGTREENRELKAKIEEIKTELIKLSESSSELEVEFKDIAIQTLPQNPGKYHLNFFARVRVGAFRRAFNQTQPDFHPDRQPRRVDARLLRQQGHSHTKHRQAGGRRPALQPRLLR